MRILHVSTRLILGGSQENTLLSCEGQARLGHEVHLAFGPIYGPEGSLLERVEQFNERCRAGEEVRADGGAVRPITTHVIEHMVREVDPATDRRGLQELKALIAQLQPDIVHTHSSKAGILGRVAAWTFARVSSPTAPGVVHTIHGPPFMPIDGGPLQRVKRRINNTIYTLAERYAARRCHVIVSVADAMTNEFLRRGIGSRDQYTTVYSGMETERFLTPPPGDTREAVRAELGLAESDFIVGTVARLAEHKGHDDLLDALGTTLKTTPNLKLLWVGDGWWRDRLLTRARALGLTIDERDQSSVSDDAARDTHDGATRPQSNRAQVILTGLVPPESVPRLIRAMDVLAHPSYREGLPRTVPQALLSGVCPVAYDVDGTGEICRDLETGRLVPLADRERLRDAIVWCMQHPIERQHLAARGQNECRDKFSAERMVRDLETVYARAVAIARRTT